MRIRSRRLKKRKCGQEEVLGGKNHEETQMLSTCGKPPYFFYGGESYPMERGGRLKAGPTVA